MIETSIAQVRSAKLVALAGFGVGGIMAVTGTYLVGMQEARAFMGMGLALILVSACWAVLLGLRATRSSGKIESWFGYLLGGMAALLTLVFVLCVMQVFPWDFLYLASATLLSALFVNVITIRQVARLENLSRMTWSATQRLEAGRARFKKLTLLSIFCFILPVWFTVCAQLTTPSWHVTLMQRLPQPLRNLTYSTVASFSMQQELLKSDSIPDEILEREIRSDLPDFFRILCFESLVRQNPALAFKLSAKALRTNWPSNTDNSYSKSPISATPYYSAYYDAYALVPRMIKYYCEHASPDQIREIARDSEATSRDTFATFVFLLKPGQKDCIDKELRALLEMGRAESLSLFRALLASAQHQQELLRCEQVWSSGSAEFIQQCTLMLWSGYVGGANEPLFTAGINQSNVETRRSILSALLQRTPQPNPTYNFPHTPNGFTGHVMKRLEDSDLIVRRMATHLVARWAAFPLKHTVFPENGRECPPDSQEERDEIKALVQLIDQTEKAIYNCKGGGTRTYGTRGRK